MVLPFSSPAEQFECSAGLEQRVGDAIRRDTRLSVRGRDGGKGLHFFEQRPAAGHIARGGEWAIPE
jgi:hypothetical protein